MSEETPARIGDFLPERLLGRGSMASVYLCRARDGSAVALKWLNTQHPPLVRRFEREIRALGRLAHPGIVGSRGSGVHDGRPYLVMEYVDGVDLRIYAPKLWKRPPAERYARARTVGQAVAEALDHLHGRGLVHRDVKPSNVLIGEDERVVLTDLGVVKDLAEDDYTAVGLMVGTVAYAAPEQLAGERIDPRVDLYGLGSTLYYLLTLRRPFDGRERLPDARPLPPSHFDPGLPPDLEAVVLRLMEPEPTRRYPDARAVAAALAAGRADGVVVAGRQRAVEAVAAAIDRVAAGARVLVAPQGSLGMGKGWLSSVARQGARRRSLTVVEVHGPADLAHARDVLREPGPALVVATLPWPDAPVDVVIPVALEPLGIADVRRTVVGAAPLTQDSARVAAELHRLTGGIPALVVSLLSRHNDGGSLDLPTEPALPTLVEDYLEGLDLDEREALEVIALAGEPVAPQLLEAVVPAPAADALRALADRGLVKEVGGRWVLTAELFRAAVVEALADPEGLGERIAAARARLASVSAPGAGLAEVDAALQAAVSGKLAEALGALRAAAGLGQALADRTVESRARCALGLVLHDLGLHGRARRHLADATALARAEGLDDTRRLSHVLRATVDLAERPGSRGAAASAIDRLMPVLTGASGRVGDLADALGFAAWARAAAFLGDRGTAERARGEVDARLDDLPLTERLRAGLALARACSAAGDVERARRLLGRVGSCGARYGLLVWQAGCLAAALDGTDRPPPGDLAEGLQPDEAAALRALVEYVPRG